MVWRLGRASLTLVGVPLEAVADPVVPEAADLDRRAVSIAPAPSIPGDDRTRSVTVPVGIVQGTTWNPALIEHVGDLLGHEAVRKAGHVLLAPGVNLQPTPIGARTTRIQLTPGP